ncbi:MAG: PA0069 family radical SAM protein [Pseudomonadota bacterium]
MIKGRGTASNPDNRYHPLQLERESPYIEKPSQTECRPVHARSMIARNQSPDVPFTQSINPYQGCEHGCIYCYARPTHAYLDLSPGIDFETRLTCKTNAPEVLRQELSAPGYRCLPITLGANTDPYQPVERRYRITRRILELLLACKHPVSLITKGSLVTRDLDILEAMATQGLCSVAISLTTLQDDLKRTLEPRASSGASRLATIASLSKVGVPVSVLYAPVIPTLNDAELEEIVSAAADSGATRAAYILLRLPGEVADLFEEWLHLHYPMKANHVMSILRQCRQGERSDTRFGHRMRGTGPFAELLAQRFRLACKRYALVPGDIDELRTDLFQPPGEPTNLAVDQMRLFD